MGERRVQGKRRVAGEMVAAARDQLVTGGAPATKRAAAGGDYRRQLDEDGEKEGGGVTEAAQLTPSAMVWPGKAGEAGRRRSRARRGGRRRGRNGDGDDYPRHPGSIPDTGRSGTMRRSCRRHRLAPKRPRSPAIWKGRRRPRCLASARKRGREGGRGAGQVSRGASERTDRARGPLVLQEAGRAGGQGGMALGGRRRRHGHGQHREKKESGEDDRGGPLSDF